MNNARYDLETLEQEAEIRHRVRCNHVIDSLRARERFDE